MSGREDQWKHEAHRLEEQLHSLAASRPSESSGLCFSLRHCRFCQALRPGITERQPGLFVNSVRRNAQHAKQEAAKRQSPLLSRGRRREKAGGEPRGAVGLEHGLVTWQELRRTADQDILHMLSKFICLLLLLLTFLPGPHQSP